jgi:bidirectional [NiFe] hydrogenase diaphorase subunit
MAANLIQKSTIDESDPRVQQIVRSIKSYKKRSDALIQVLHIVQDLYGYVPAEMLRLVSRELRVPPSRVYGVVTFYHYFSLRPKGEHTCVICLGTACYVKGAERILERVEHAFSLQPGETTPDKKLGLQTARCLGACGLAPAAVLDNIVMAKVDAERLIPMIRSRMEALT